MTPERKKFTILSPFLICGMLVFAALMLRRTPHHSAFNVAFLCLSLLNSLLLVWFNKTSHSQTA